MHQMCSSFVFHTLARKHTHSSEGNMITALIEYNSWTPS